MPALLLRRRRLGNGSCRGIAANNPSFIVHRHDRRPNFQWASITHVFRWGCTAQIPTGGGPTGPQVLNKVEAIHLTVDKVAFRKALAAAELSGPIWQQFAQVVFPAVVRPVRHWQGRHTYKVNNNAELNQAVARCVRAAGGWYASPFVDKVAEYRVFVVQGRVACVARKTPSNPQAVAWNVAQGGSFDNVSFDNWPLKAVKQSIKAFNLSDLDFGGVDIMVDAEGGCHVLEINAAPSLTSPYRLSCMAKCFQWIVDKGKDRIGLIEDRGGWRKFVHPAVSAEAQLITGVRA